MTRRITQHDKLVAFFAGACAVLRRYPVGQSFGEAPQLHLDWVESDIPHLAEQILRESGVPLWAQGCSGYSTFFLSHLTEGYGDYGLGSYDGSGWGNSRSRAGCGTPFDNHFTNYLGYGLNRLDGSGEGSSQDGHRYFPNSLGPGAGGGCAWGLNTGTTPDLHELHTLLEERPCDLPS